MKSTEYKGVYLPKSDKYGYVHNCLLVSRDGDSQMFIQDDDSVRPTLDGYAIIPIEQYEKLLEDK